jgi:hypothetical protein
MLICAHAYIRGGLYVYFGTTAQARCAKVQKLCKCKNLGGASAKALQVQKLALRPSAKTSAKTLICPARCFDL